MRIGKELEKKILMRIQVQMRKEMNALSNLTMFILILMLSFFSQESRGQSVENDIFITIQNHYNRCLTSKVIGNDSVFLTPMLPTLNSHLDDTINISIELKKFIAEDEWFHVCTQLLMRDQTYWKPNIYCDSTKISIGFHPSISKPIVYGNGTRASVIGYGLKKGYQTVTFLFKEDNRWKVIGDVNVGVYLKKSGKISEYKVPNKH